MEMKFNYFITISVVTLVSNCFAIYSNCKLNSKIEFLNNYDFVIVGGGSSGSVVANRLSADCDVTVLLLEAGGEPNLILNEIPKMQTHLEKSDQDWNFLSEAQTAPFFRSHSNIFSLANGKVLGGSSSINAMIYVRGNRKDYEAWNDQVEGGWSWKEVLHFFKKSEDIQVANVDKSHHGKGGPLTVSESNFKDWSTDLFLKAAGEIGWKRRDVNGENQNGIMPVQYTMRNGSRCSTHKAFLKPIYDRPNLHIVTNAFVRKVLLKTNPNSKPVASGVQFQCGESRLTALVSKEVILSAGAFQSPQLLLLSGIGPREQLKKFDNVLKSENKISRPDDLVILPCLRDLGRDFQRVPDIIQVRAYGFTLKEGARWKFFKISSIVHLPGVGENLINHVKLVNIYFVSDAMKEACPAPYDFEGQLVEWSMKRSGSMTSALGLPNLIGNYLTSNDAAEADWPQIQLVLLESEETFAARDVFTAALILLRPISRGVVRLRNADPETPPIIDPRFFDDRQDLDELIKAIDFLVILNNTKALLDAKILLKIKQFPACSNYGEFSTEHLRCSIQEMVVPLRHYVGTCKMGNNNDPMAVVDSKLRVFNVSGLRVIDASIMPNVPSGNTNAPCIMVGERGSDFIKKLYSHKSCVH